MRMPPLARRRRRRCSRAAAAAVGESAPRRPCARVCAVVHVRGRAVRVRVARVLWHACWALYVCGDACAVFVKFFLCPQPCWSDVFSVTHFGSRRGVLTFS